MNAVKNILLASIPGIMLVSSCVKEKEFPKTPLIVFKQYINYGPADSADCIILFKDGDGDIGRKGEDVSNPNDLKMKYLYKDPVDGEFKPVDDDNNPVNGMQPKYYDYRVPYLTPDGQFKALEGEVRAKLRAQPIYYPGHHVIKFEITLRDRAGNISNVVTTPEINVP
jgi:hypothetical protein